MVSAHINPDRLFGIDVAQNYLKQCRANIPEMLTFAGSASDCAFMSSIGSTFDFVVVGAVLHHIVSGNRRKSIREAEKSLVNSWELVKNEGFLIIEEPTYSPEYLMSLLFYIKKFATVFTDDRIELGGKDNNIGPPVVSYISHNRLRAMAEGLDHAVIIAEKKTPRRITRTWHRLGIRERFESLLIVQKR
jgi:hypothetical protein